MRTLVKYSRTYEILENGEKRELAPFGLPTEDSNHLACVVSVTKKELHLLLAGEIDLLFRKSWPKKLKGFPTTLYFTIVKDRGRIAARGYLYFVMHTIGTQIECERAAIKPEKFEKKFYNPKFDQASAIAWNIRNVEPYEGTFSDFICIPDYGRPRQMQHLTRAFAYVVKGRCT